jgi:hypothetical protein
MSTAGNRGAGFPQEQGRTESWPRTEDSSIGATAGRMAGAVKEKAQDVASSAANLAGQVKDKAQDVAARVGDTAQETWESTRQGAQQLASTAASQAGEWIDDCTRLIRRYPIGALCCAFGLGFLLAKGMEAMSNNRG